MITDLFEIKIELISSEKVIVKRCCLLASEGPD